MRITKGFSCAVICLGLSAVLVAPATADATERELWSKAVESFSLNDDWQAGRVEVSFVQYNRRNERISSYRSIMAVTVGTDGKLETTVLESYQDGDPDDASRSGGPFGGDDNAFSVLQTSPFDPAEQHRVRTRGTDALRTIDGRSTRAYEYTVRGDGKRSAVGTAWLDVNSGKPVLLEATIEPLPGYLESFDASQRYSENDGKWTTESLDFTAEVKFLLIRRTIESSMRFSDYFRYRE